jgi:hypothetical protein
MKPDVFSFLFKYEIWNPLVCIFYVPKKKIVFFQCGIKKTFWFKYFNLKWQYNIFSTWDLKPFRIYTLCSHEKSYVFSMWNLKPISIYTLYSQEKNYIFLMWDLKLISIYILCFEEKNHVFSMWDKKTFWFKHFNFKG